MSKEINAAKKSGRLIPFILNGEHFFQKGMRAYHQRNLHKARKYLERAVKFDSEDTEIICQLAAVLAEMGEYQASNEWLDYILSELDSELHECYFFMANNYAHIGMFQEAEEKAKQYLEKEPHGDFRLDVEELIELIEYETDDHFEEALGEEEMLIQKHESARSAIESGDFERAILLLDSMTEEYPTFWPAYNNLALAYFYSNQYDEAIEVLNNILSKNQGNLNAVCNLALFYHFLGHSKKSEAFLERLRNVYPIHPDHRHKLGSTFGILGEYELAYRWLHSLQNTRYGMDHQIYHWLAVSSLHMGNKNKAYKYWKKTEDLDPEGEVAPYFLYMLESGKINLKEAIFQYRIPEGKGLDDDPFLNLIGSVSGAEKAKLVHLMLLRQHASSEGEEILRSYIGRKEEPYYLKEMAAYVLLKHCPDEPAVILDRDVPRTFTNESDFPENVLHSVGIVEKLYKANFSTAELNDILSSICTPLYIQSQTAPLSFKNRDAWTAAIIYAWKKVKKQPVTQRELAEQFGVSTASIAKYVKRIHAILNRP
ncbi:tetratricopeptide repeat protein [Pseudalkalibacillus caeni]|nr:tetratricopeptide repeat protein [Pseudalkalibacillus caeni]